MGRFKLRVPRSSTYLRRSNGSRRRQACPLLYWPTAGDVDRNIRRAGGRTRLFAGRRNKAEHDASPLVDNKKDDTQSRENADVRLIIAFF